MEGSYLKGGGGCSAYLSPHFYDRALPQHPLIVKGKDEIVLVYAMMLCRGGSSVFMAVQLNSDLDCLTVEVFGSPTVRHSLTHTRTHIYE